MSIISAEQPVGVLENPEKTSCIEVGTRRGHDWTDRFDSVALAAWELKTYGAIIDGEVIVPTARGQSDFHALERDLGAGRSDRFVYYAFDLLYLDGLDLREAAL